MNENQLCHISTVQWNTTWYWKRVTLSNASVQIAMPSSAGREWRKGTETHGQKEAETGWCGLLNGKATAPWKLSVFIIYSWTGLWGSSMELKEAGLGSPSRRAVSAGRESQQESHLCREAVFRQQTWGRGQKAMVTSSPTLSMLVNGPQEDFSFPLCLTWGRFCHLQRAETLGFLTWPTPIKKRKKKKKTHSLGTSLAPYNR